MFKSYKQTTTLKVFIKQEFLFTLFHINLAIIRGFIYNSVRLSVCQKKLQYGV